PRAGTCRQAGTGRRRQIARLRARRASWAREPQAACRLRPLAVVVTYQACLPSISTRASSPCCACWSSGASAASTWSLITPTAASSRTCCGGSGRSWNGWGGSSRPDPDGLEQPVGLEEDPAADDEIGVAHGPDVPGGIAVDEQQVGLLARGD